MNTPNKVPLGFFLIAVFLCIYMYSSYRSLVEHKEKVYILEMDSGRVWAIDTTLSHFPRPDSALETLVPWATSPIFVPNGDADLIGELVVADGKTDCKRFLSEQVACTTFVDSETAPDVIVDYEKYTWPQHTTPFTKIVEAVVSKYRQMPSDGPPLVFSVRAVALYRPGEKDIQWRTENMGPAVAFQGKGAHYFARIVGITVPSIEEFYQR